MNVRYHNKTITWNSVRDDCVNVSLLFMILNVFRRKYSPIQMTDLIVIALAAAVIDTIVAALANASALVLPIPRPADAARARAVVAQVRSIDSFSLTTNFSFISSMLLKPILSYNRKIVSLCCPFASSAPVIISSAGLKTWSN